MGNNSAKHHSSHRDRPKKNVHWKSAEPPSTPGKPIQVPHFETPAEVLAIKWERPYTDGGSPIIGYLVEHRRVGSPTWIKATPTLVLIPELSLTGLDPTWRYQFRVFAQNVVGISESSSISDPVSVILQRNENAAPQFLNELQDSTVLENDQCEFQVNAIGKPTPQINWFKDGFEIFSSRRTKIINDHGSSTLTIHQAALTDEGEIKCTATNRVGHVITKFQLKIEAPPKIRLPRQYEDGLLVEAGEVIKLKVGIAGRPTPGIAWTHNGEIVKNGGRFEITTNEKNSFLKIMKATRKDRGEYNVRAINKLGEFNSSFLVTVTAKPSPPENVRITMSLGKSVTLTWSAPGDDGGCKIGNYIVEYFRIGWDVWLKASSTRQLTATLSDLIEGSEYKFRVKAESPYGLSEPSQESKILFVPDHKRGIISPSRERTSQDDKDLTFSFSQMTHKNQNEFEHNSKVHKNAINQIVIPDVPKNVELISQIYDDESIARELNYGTTVDIVYKKKEITTNLRRKSDDTGKHISQISVKSPQAAKTENQMQKKETNDPVQSKKTVIIAADNYDRQGLTGHNSKNDGKQDKLAPTSDEVHTSNEFMLVLYNDDNDDNDDNENARNQSEEKNHFDLDLNEAIAAPPLSLSTPDLHELHHNPFYPLRRSASSSELLYEKVMQRFYQAVELDEAEMERKRSMSVEPKLNLTSAWTRTNESGFKPETVENNLVNDEYTFDTLRDDKNSSKLLQHELKTTKTLEIEKEGNRCDWEKEYDRDLRREIIDSQRKRSLNSREPLPSALYEDDYTDSTASTGSISVSASVESIEQFMNSVRSASSSTTNVRQPVNDELETYHPRMEVRALSPYRTPEPGQAAVILNKPVPLPDPDYIPKPILKRPPNESNGNDKNVSSKDNAKPPAPSPPILKPEKEKRSFLQLFGKKTTSAENLKKPLNDNTPDNKAQNESKNLKKANEKTVEKDKVLQQRQNSMEENMVVVDHYSDLVRELGGKAKPKVPLYLNSEAFRDAAIRAEIEEKENAAKFERKQRQTALNEHAESIKKTKTQEDEEEALRLQELANKLKHYQDSTEQSQSNSSQKDLIEISVEQTKSISYSLREIKQQDTIPKNESIQIAKSPSEMRKLNGGSSHSTPSKVATPTKSRNSSLSRQARSESRSGRRSQSKSPLSECKASLTSTILKVTRMPIQNTYANINIDLPSSNSSSVSPEPRCKTPEELKAEAETHVRSTLSYTTDLAMFLLACWLYVFRDARLAIPILILMVYRQARSAFEKKLQKWTKRKKD